MNEHYVGHQRHIKATITDRVDRLLQQAEERDKAMYQLETFILALAKAAGEELSEEDRRKSYHRSFDHVAECVLWHVPKTKYRELIEQLYSMPTEVMWRDWIWPRVKAVEAMRRGAGGLICRPASRYKMFWDDDIEIRSSAKYGYPDSGWYEVNLKKVEVNMHQQETPENKTPTPKGAEETELPPTPPVFTPHPVARPWWFKLFDKLRR